MAAGAMNNLMAGLGFGSGYLVQGGDLGSFVSRFLAMQYDACKGMHVNMMAMPPPSENSDELPMDEEEKKALQKASEFVDTAYAFALEQGTRTATIGLTLSASPLALLSWIGEKILEWTYEDPPLETILEHVTLYWLTDTIPRCFYHNRGMGNPDEKPRIARTSVVRFSSLFCLFEICIALYQRIISIRSCETESSWVNPLPHDKLGQIFEMQKITNRVSDRKHNTAETSIRREAFRLLIICS